VKVSSIIQTILVGLTLLAFVPTSSADESTTPDEAAQQSAGRDVASKHKGKKKHRGHRGHHGSRK